jgi:hypothetical protein
MAQRGRQKPGRRSKVPTLSSPPKGQSRQLSPLEVQRERIGSAHDLLVLVLDGKVLPEAVHARVMA